MISRNLFVTLGYESSLCDSTIQQEARQCATTILQMQDDLLLLNPLSDSVSEKISSSDLEPSIFESSSLLLGEFSGGEFFVEGGAESFVRIEDFGGGANSFFQIPPDFRIPLGGGGGGGGVDSDLSAVLNMDLNASSNLR